MTHFSELGSGFVALPGTWSKVDLRTEAGSRSTARRVVEEAMGRSDELATARADLRRRIIEVAAGLREVGGVGLWLAREIVPSVPFPAWLTVFAPEVPEGLDGEGRLAALRASIAETSEEPSTPVVADASEEIRVLRSVSRRLMTADGPEPAQYSVTQADYWVVPQANAGVYLMSFSVIDEGHAESLLRLFDAIVATFTPTVRGDAAMPRG